MQEESETVLTEREQKRLDRETRIQERINEEKRLKAEYYKIAKTPALNDLREKLRSFADYHTKIARDGVGFENKVVGTQEGSPIEQQVVVRLSAEQRVSELDKAAGIEEIIDYLDRKVTIEPSKKETK